MDILNKLYEMTAFAQTGGDWTFLIMILIAFVLLYLGIVKKYEPLLLIPIGFGVLLANFPGGGMGVVQAASDGTVVLPDGSTEIKQHETRMECLFRHFRNAIAHNHTYLFDNENIMFEDCDESGKISARILMPKNALLTWIEIVRSGNGNQ